MSDACYRAGARNYFGSKWRPAILGSVHSSRLLSTCDLHRPLNFVSVHRLARGRRQSPGHLHLCEPEMVEICSPIAALEDSVRPLSTAQKSVGAHCSRSSELSCQWLQPDALRCLCNGEQIFGRNSQTPGNFLRHLQTLGQAISLLLPISGGLAQWLSQ